MSAYKHGIFCLEGDWYGIKDQTTVEPLLDLLHLCRKVPFIHRDVGTRAEFDHYLRKWTQKALSKYPVLYLAFHGEPGALYVGEKRGPLTLEELGGLLEGCCQGQVIHFGSCSTMDEHGARLNSFLARTQALAVMGYREDVDWVESAAFEVILLGSLMDVSMTKQGMGKLERLLDERSRDLKARLGFRMKVR